MSIHLNKIDSTGAAWKIEVYADRCCIDCIVDCSDDSQGGLSINRFDRMISVYNIEIIDRDECVAEGNHVDTLDDVVQYSLDTLVEQGKAVQDANGNYLAVDNG